MPNMQSFNSQKIIGFLQLRIQYAYKASLVHLACSFFLAGIGAFLVFFIWFPGDFRHITGGQELFWLIVCVDLICGPFLTLLIFSPKKSQRELFIDLGLVALVQISLLLYGLYTVWQIRPLYFAFEKDRFKVVSVSDLQGASTETLLTELQPGLFKKPIVVGLRPFENVKERNEVLMSALTGGPDYGDMPEYYIPYEADVAKEVAKRSKPITIFLQRHQEQTEAALEIAKTAKTSMENLFYLPIRARNDWIAVLSQEGRILGYIKGDGF